MLIKLDREIYTRYDYKICFRSVGRGGGGTWAGLGSLFELGDVHGTGHVTARGPSCRYLLGPQSPLVSSS